MVSWCILHRMLCVLLFLVKCMPGHSPRFQSLPGILHFAFDTSLSIAAQADRENLVAFCEQRGMPAPPPSLHWIWWTVRSVRRAHIAREV